MIYHAVIQLEHEFLNKAKYAQYHMSNLSTLSFMEVGEKGRKGERKRQAYQSINSGTFSATNQTEILKHSNPVFYQLS